MDKIMRPEISVVTLVYMAENILETLVSEIQKVIEKLGISFEIILVEDRSPDGSWEVMKNLKLRFSFIKCIRFSRNFGQYKAIMAGLSKANGNWVAVMDCDMQDHPKEIEKLYKKATQENYKVDLTKMKPYFKTITPKEYIHQMLNKYY